MKNPCLLTTASIVALLGACSGEVAPPNDASAHPDSSAQPDTSAQPDASAADALNPPGDAHRDPWACLGRVAPVVPGGSEARINFHVRDFQNAAPMVGVAVKVCARTDAACTSPQSNGASDAAGNVSLTAAVGPMGFDGYFELTGGTGRSQIAPTRMFPNAPLAAGAQTFVFDAIPQATFDALGGLLGARLDAMTGAITALAVDCSGHAVRGVAVEVSPPAVGAQPFYFVGAVPSATANQTDDSGLLGYVNVAPGTYTLAADRVNPRARLGVITFDVRPGFVTDIVNIRPMP